jgi:hypothetical protein
MEHEKTKPIKATCPECRGPLSQIQSNGLTQFECLVGHRYSALSALQSHCEAEEKVLWSAVVALEEASVLVESMVSVFDDPWSLSSGSRRRIENGWGPRFAN